MPKKKKKRGTLSFLFCFQLPQHASDIRGSELPSMIGFYESGSLSPSSSLISKYIPQSVVNLFL